MKENFVTGSEAKRTGRELVQKGTIFSYYHDTIEFANGNKEIWDFLYHQGAAATLPVLNNGNILLVHQWRNALDRYTYEIPAGGLKFKDEDRKLAALRELEEETGYKANKCEFLIRVASAVAYSSELIDVYLATDLVPGKKHLDENEYVEVKEFTLEECNELIFSGKLQDCKTIGAIMAYQQRK